jgi:DNA topoisomerase-1
VRFDFTGKSGKRHAIDLHDARLAAIVARMQDLPGEELFGYETATGEVVDVKSDDVNAYLRAAGGAEFSAKDFRTWAGTVLAAAAFATVAGSTAHRPTKKNLAAIVMQVAERLGNTPAVCRKCYIHPAVLEDYLAGESVPVSAVGKISLPSAGLSALEHAVLARLEQKARRSLLTLAQQLERSVRRNRARGYARPRSRATRVTAASRGSASNSGNARATRRSAAPRVSNRNRDRLSHTNASRSSRRHGERRRKS